MRRLADSESPDQTVWMRSDLGLRCPHMPEEILSHGAAKLIILCKLFITSENGLTLKGKTLIHFGEKSFRLE